MRENHYTASHWGIYRVDHSAAGPRLLPYENDPDPSPIGFHQLDESLTRLRVRRPAVRRGWLEHGPGSHTDRRGWEPFVEVEWDQALDLVANEIRRVKAAHGNRAIFGGSYGWSSAGRFHHAQSQVHRFLNMAGGYVRSVDTYSLGAGMVILPHIISSAATITSEHNSWDVLAAHTKLFVTFGGVPAKNTQISSGGAADHRARPGLCAMAAAGTEFVNIGPVADNLETGARVEWIPLRPNTDTALLLALCHTLLAEGLHDAQFLSRYCTGFEIYRAYLEGVTDGIAKSADWAAPITGVPPETIRHLARRLAATRSIVNTTWSLQRAAHGEQPVWALVALACMLGQIGLPGGGFGFGYGAFNSVGSPHRKFAGPTLPQGANPVREFIPVARIADMLLHPGENFTYNGKTAVYPDIRLIYWAGGNPFHHHQDLNRLRRAWMRPETIIVHEQYWTATAGHADIVLPATTTLERNDIGSAVSEGHLIAMKRVMPAFADSRDDFAIFADLSRRLGSWHEYTEGLDEFGWLRRLYAETAASIVQVGMNMPDFDTFWQQGLLSFAHFDRPVVMLEAFRADPNAAPLPTPSGRIELFSSTIAGFGLKDCAGHPAWFEPFEWLGAPLARKYPLHLVSDQPSHRLHSQLDSAGYSESNKINGRERVWLNTADARARGIAHGDLVELFNDRGRCLAAAVPTDDVMPGVARLATGAWYDAEPETGDELRGNPNVLTLDRGASGLSQGCAAQTCLIEVVKSTRANDPLSPITPPPLINRA